MKKKLLIILTFISLFLICCNNSNQTETKLNEETKTLEVSKEPSITSEKNKIEVTEINFEKKQYKLAYYVEGKLYKEVQYSELDYVELIDISNDYPNFKGWKDCTTKLYVSDFIIDKNYNFYYNSNETDDKEVVWPNDYLFVPKQDPWYFVQNPLIVGDEIKLELTSEIEGHTVVFDATNYTTSKEGIVTVENNILKCLDVGTIVLSFKVFDSNDEVIFESHNWKTNIYDRNDPKCIKLVTSKLTYKEPEQPYYKLPTQSQPLQFKNQTFNFYKIVNSDGELHNKNDIYENISLVLGISYNISKDLNNPIYENKKIILNFENKEFENEYGKITLDQYGTLIFDFKTTVTLFYIYGDFNCSDGSCNYFDSYRPVIISN